MPNSPAVINYGTDARAWYARRRTWRVAALSLLMVAGLVGLYRIAGPYLDQYSFIRFQNRLKSDFLPVGTVVYTEDEARVAQLEGLPKYTRFTFHPDPQSQLPPPIVPKTIQHSDPVYIDVGVHVGRVPLTSHFRGLRNTASGTPTLVGMALCAYPEQELGRVFVLGSSTTLAGWRPGSRGAYSQFTQSLEITLGPTDRLTLFAGQPDPQDPTKWTIDYEINGQRGTIDGSLGEDRKALLTVRDGPAKVRREPKAPATAPAG